MYLSQMHLQENSYTDPIKDSKLCNYIWKLNDMAIYWQKDKTNMRQNTAAMVWVLFSEKNKQSALTDQEVRFISNLWNDLKVDLRLSGKHRSP